LEALIGNPDQPMREHLIQAPFHEKNLSIRSGKWVYIGARGSGGFGGNTGGPGAVAWAGEKNSDITPAGGYRKDAPTDQLYDLSVDVSQATNVVREHPEVARELRRQLREIKQDSR